MSEITNKLDKAYSAAMSAFLNNPKSRAIESSIKIVDLHTIANHFFTAGADFGLERALTTAILNKRKSIETKPHIDNRPHKSRSRRLMG